MVVDDERESSTATRARSTGSVEVLAWSVGLAGVLGVTLAIWWDPRLATAHIPLGLAALVSTFPAIKLNLDDSSGHGVTLGESALVAMVIVDPTGVVPLLMAAGTLVSGVARRVGPLKMAYNFGADGLAAALGVAAARTIVGDVGGQGLLPALAAGVAAAFVYQLVQLVLIAELHRRLSGTPWTQTARNAASASVTTTVFTVLLGALLGIASEADAAAAWLGLPMLVGLWVAMRSLNEAANATHTSLHLHEVTNDIADASTTLDGAVAKIARTFGARAVLLTLPGEDGPVEHVHDVVGDGLGDLRRAVGNAEAVDEPVQVDTARHAVAVVAPINGPRGRGHLVVAGTTAQWTDREVALLGTLATHLGTNLRTLALLEQVTEESRKLTDIIEAAGDGIALIGADAQVVTWNPGMERLSGVGSDAIGRPIGQVLTWRDPDDGSRDSALPPALEATLRGEETGPVDLEVLRGDRWRHARCRFSPVGTPETGVTGAVLVARDRTMEADLDQVKHDFIAIVSHEIRTPLTPLKGMVELFASRGDDVTGEIRAQMVEAMGRQLDRLDTLVSDLLTVADLDGGTLALRPVPVAAAEVCREAVAHHVPDERRDGVVLDLDDQVTVRADRSALARIVEALLTNAVKHGGDSIEVVVARQGGDGIIEIRDDGPGIPEWEHAAVFERFRRVGTNLEWSTQGPGLGLAIAAELAERMDMHIELDSAAGQGACFRLIGTEATDRAGSPAPGERRGAEATPGIDTT